MASVMKNIVSDSLCRRAEEALRACLAEVPFGVIEDVSMSESGLDRGVDLDVQYRIGTSLRRLFVQVKSSGQPRWARAAELSLRVQVQSSPNAYGIFAAPFITSETAAQLADQGIGYVDFAGNCRLCFDAVYIRREGRTNPFTEKRDLRSLYSPRAERVLRVLSQDPKRSWKVQELARAAEVSIGLVSNVKRLLQDRDWLSTDNEGMRLTQPRKLLEEWRETYALKRNRRYEFFTLDPTANVERRIADASQEASSHYALAAFSAAARYAPSVRYQRAFAYVEDARTIAKSLSLKPVDSGANVTLLEPYDTGVYLSVQEIDGIALTSPLQTYLDLLGLRGRGEEAAEALLRDVLEPTW